MKFFVPKIKDANQFEEVYRGIAKFVGAPIGDKRIWKLHWCHNGRIFDCEVGHPMPPYYEMGDDPVIAIFDCDGLYKICTINRGGVRGGPVLAGKDHDSEAIYFED